MSKAKRIALIDGDIVAYRAASVAQEDFNWGEVTSQTTDFEGAKNKFRENIATIVMQARCHAVPVICFTSPDNFRYEVLPTYKHNRQDKERPVLLEDLKAWAQESYDCRLKPRLEADDVLGIVATRQPNIFVVCSLDKDLNQIPGWHYNWVKNSLYQVTDSDADRLFYRQTLTGDTTDGYSGCPKIGPVKADKLLDETPRKDWWQMIVEQYAKKGLDEDAALQQARVARILRHTDYDFEKKEPILWAPI